MAVVVPRKPRTRAAAPARARAAASNTSAPEIAPAPTPAPAPAPTATPLVAVWLPAVAAAPRGGRAASSRESRRAEPGVGVRGSEELELTGDHAPEGGG